MGVCYDPSLPVNVSESWRVSFSGGSAVEKRASGQRGWQALLNHTTADLQDSMRFEISVHERT